jgi:predicted AlkP superfamily phosphohydrolase/phosphomutase
MPRGAVIAATLVLGFGTTSVAVASTVSRTTRGWVAAVDAATKTVKVKGKNDEVAFKLEDTGKVMEKNKTATFDALKPGEHVMIHYTGSGNERVASEVVILAAPTSKTATMHKK